MTPATARNDLHMQEFRARVQRCELRARQVQRERQQWAGERARAVRRRNVARSPISLLIAVLSGAAAVVASRYLRAVYGDGALAGEGAQVAMIMDCGLALFVALVLKSLLGLPGRKMLLGQIAGLGLMLVAMHDLVHAAPQLWAQAFPPEWVSEVLNTTRPGSILIRGRSFVL